MKQEIYNKIMLRCVRTKQYLSELTQLWYQNTHTETFVGHQTLYCQIEAFVPLDFHSSTCRPNDKYSYFRNMRKCDCNIFTN